MESHCWSVLTLITIQVSCDFRVTMALLGTSLMGQVKTKRMVRELLMKCFYNGLAEELAMILVSQQ